MTARAAEIVPAAAEPASTSVSKTEQAGMRAIVKGQEKLHRGLRQNITKCLAHEWCLVGIVHNEVGQRNCCRPCQATLHGFLLFANYSCLSFNTPSINTCMYDSVMLNNQRVPIDPYEKITRNESTL